MAQPICLGIDPGTDGMALALCSPTALLTVAMVKAPDLWQMARRLIPALQGFGEFPLVCIESQVIYPASPVEPNSVVKLARAAGIAIGAVAAAQPTASLVLPEPRQWKGQVPKPIQQARTFAHYGISFSQTKTYAYPSGCAKSAAIRGLGKVNKGDWLHLADAAGLALYALRAVEHGA